MIKMILLTGFLGAGKTTLLKTILKEYKDRRIGVIVNEFGEINIDAKLVRGDGIRITELSNGSVFCACIKDKFIESLIDISRSDIEFLFIEASGLADPANMQTIVNAIRPKTKNDYDYMGSICVVDGESFTDLYEVLPAITSQIRYSSAVIINKSDLIDGSIIKEIRRIISEINPWAQIQTTEHCRFDIKGTIENLIKTESEAHESVNTVESRPNTFIIVGVREADTVPYDNLAGFLKDFADQTYRIKGFARTDKGNVEVNCVGGNVEISPWGEDVSETALVVISSVGFKLISAITKAMEKHVKDFLRL